ncbi:MAG: pentapeptide repeat-containing protein [Alphaproteobacteria bacterium]|nr:pentapeptide repeat-containing protein [Alphaproteobacteria bacterium]
MDNNNNEKVQLDISESKDKKYIEFKFTKGALKDKTFTYKVIENPLLTGKKVDVIELNSYFYKYIKNTAKKISSGFGDSITIRGKKYKSITRRKYKKYLPFVKIRSLKNRFVKSSCNKYIIVRNQTEWEALKPHRESLNSEHSYLFMQECTNSESKDKICINDNKWVFPNSIFAKAVEIGSAEKEITYNLASCIFAGGFHVGNNTLREAVANGFNGFSNSIFLKEANFIGATFSDKANFYGATFNGEAYFGSATFNGEANFIGATFSDKANFYSAKFSGEANFYSVIFSGEANFYSAKFSGDLDISATSFTYLELTKSQISISKINAKNTSVEKDIIMDDPKSADNQDIYRIVKDLAIKQNNKPLAWEYYEREMNQKLKEDGNEIKTWLKTKNWKKNFTLLNPILLFNKITNSHGTNSLKAVIWIISCVLLGSIIEYIIYNYEFDFILSYFTLDITIIEHTFSESESLNDFTDIVLSYSFFPIVHKLDYSITSPLQRWIHFFFTAVLVALIWQLVQSFRRYSKMP